jgi:release factor glutamine methyltransferase
VTLAVHLPEATIYALDDSAGALAVAARNVRHHGVGSRMHLLEGDLLTPLPEPVDLITANLPYVTTDEWRTLPPEIRDHEPREALDGGPDGLVVIRRLLAEADSYLRPNGVILLEIGATQGQAVTALARKEFPQARIGLCQDYAALDRVVIVEAT